MTAPASRRPRPARAGLVDGWHRAECLIAVGAFGFIALVLIVDVAGRELLTPIYRLSTSRAAAGVFAAQKMCVYALVIGSFCGVGVATATGSHLLPRLGFGWVPKDFGPTMDRIADLVTGLFFVGVAWYGWVYVHRRCRPGCACRPSTCRSGRSSWPSRWASCPRRCATSSLPPGRRCGPLPPEFQE